jgi:hypothetical protein
MPHKINMLFEASILRATTLRYSCPIKKGSRTRPTYRTLRATLLFGGECTSRSRILAQDMVIWGEGWYAGVDEKTIKKYLKKSWPAVV